MRLRVWVAACLILLALPLAGAAWAFGSYAAANERTRTDSRLDASIRAAVSEYGRRLDVAELTAMRLATARRLQRALVRRDRRALARIARGHPGVVLELPGERRRVPGLVRRSVDVVSGGRTVGTVVAFVALDRATASGIARAAGLGAQGEVAAISRDGLITASSTAGLAGPSEAAGARPGQIRAGGRGYRAVGANLAPGTQLLVLAPNRAVEAAASSVRDRILLIGLGVLVAVMLLAYLLAPAMGRARLARYQRALAERVLGHVADGVVLLDPHDVVRFWNDAAETITDVPASRALGARIGDVLRGWPAAAAQIPVSEAGAPAAASLSATVPVEADERELWLAASAVRFDEGTVYTFRDISEAERLDRAKTDFVATVSHELRTPLAAVYGAVMTLRHHRERLSSRQQDDLLALLGDQADRLSGIIDDILLASSLDAGPVGLEHEHFDPEDVAKRVVAAARVRARGREIELSLPPSVPDVCGDAAMVAQVLANLVENAIKYSPDGGRVEVAVNLRDNRVRFEVRDHGLGIPLRERERIFKKFYRLDPNLSRGIGGTGLGLYISRELMRRMGGDIGVRSTPGEGSTFSFELPLAGATERIRATA